MLIGQNSDTNRPLLFNSLSQAGYQATEIRYASEVLLPLRTTQVNTLLLDINFPEIDKYSAQIFNFTKANHIPVILVCKKEDVDTVNNLSQQADAYITQPIKCTELLFKIKSLCQTAELRQQLMISEMRLSAILHHSSSAIAYTDIQLNIIKTNAQFLLQFGRNKDLKQLSDIVSFPPKKNQLEKNSLDSILQDGYFKCEIKIQHREGHLIWTDLRGELIDQKMPEKGFIWTLEDITSHKNEQEQLQLAATVFDVSGEAMIILDEQGNIKKTNPALQKLFGYSSHELHSHHATELFDSAYNQQTINDILILVKEQQWKGELWVRKKNNIQFPVRIIINSIKRPDDTVCHFVALLADISKHKAEQRELKYRANHDPLTGLPNRSEFFERLNEILAIAKRNQYSVALLYLDLDGFKPINDTLGHGKGDDVLLEVAGKLQRSIREVDIVARLGGDEFAIVLNGTSEDVVTCTAERLIQTISMRVENSLQLSVSIGISIFPHDTINPIKLLQYADEAMYKAKHQGKHSFCWHNTQTYLQNN